MSFIHLEREHDYGAAVDAATVAVQMAGTDDTAAAFMIRAEGHLRTGNVEAAVRDFSRLIRLNPADSLPYLLRGRCLLR